MENKINVAEILRNCPTGMELDCAMFENVTFKCVNNGIHYPIEIAYPVDGELYTIELTKYGCWSLAENAKCVIFPKGKTTWEGFVPPYNFKDGDVVATNGEPCQLFLLKHAKYHKNNNGYDGYCYFGWNFRDNRLFKEGNWGFNRLATEEEKQKLFQTIKDNGYNWNEETKTLEKVVPKFKVGDKIQHKNGYSLDVSILKINADCYTVKDFIGDQITIDFTHQDNYELVHNKFDLNTLKPFESRVLVRNSKDQDWIPAFWGYRVKDGYVTTFGHSVYCIPHERNEHLLGKTDNCSDFYKTWKKLCQG